MALRGLVRCSSIRWGWVEFAQFKKFMRAKKMVPAMSTSGCVGFKEGWLVAFLLLLMMMVCREEEGVPSKTDLQVATQYISAPMAQCQGRCIRDFNRIYMSN
jgi:hypothetical protein